MSAPASQLRPPTLVAHAADAVPLAQILRALRAQPGIAAICGPPELARAALEVLEERLGPPLRVLAVAGGAALGPDAFCERALGALRAEASGEPRGVFEAYLAHLRSRSARLALLVDAADALPEATVDWLADRVRSATGALCVVAAGEGAEPLLRLAERCGAHASLIRLGRAAEEPAEADRGGASPRPASATPRAATAPAPVGSARRSVARPLGAAALGVALVAGLVWSLSRDEGSAPRAAEPVEAADRTVDPPAAVPEDPAAGALVALPSDERGTRSDPIAVSAPAPRAARSAADVALDALEAGDADAYRSAMRRIDGQDAARAEAALLQRLEDRRPGDRERRMLAAWGLGLVGGRAALAALDAAASDADRHVAALAERSAALIRARLEREASGSAPR